MASNHGTLSILNRYLYEHFKNDEMSTVFQVTMPFIIALYTKRVGYSGIINI